MKSRIYSFALFSSVLETCYCVSASLSTIHNRLARMTLSLSKRLYSHRHLHNSTYVMHTHCGGICFILLLRRYKKKADMDALGKQNAPSIPFRLPADSAVPIHVCVSKCNGGADGSVSLTDLVTRYVAMRVKTALDERVAKKLCNHHEEGDEVSII